MNGVLVEMWDKEGKNEFMWKESILLYGSLLNYSYFLLPKQVTKTEDAMNRDRAYKITRQLQHTFYFMHCHGLMQAHKSCLLMQQWVVVGTTTNNEYSEIAGWWESERKLQDTRLMKVT